MVTAVVLPALVAAAVSLVWFAVGRLTRRGFRVDEVHIHAVLGVLVAGARTADEVALMLGLPGSQVWLVLHRLLARNLVTGHGLTGVAINWEAIHALQSLQSPRTPEDD